MPTTLDVRSLILDDIDETASTRTKPKSKPTFSVAMADGCDIAVRRVTKSTSKLLVLLVSQMQYYVKDERTGVVTRLDEGVLSRFLGGIRCVEVGEASWLPAIYGTKGCVRTLLSMLGNEDVVRAIRRGNVAVKYENVHLYPDCQLRYGILKTKLSQWFAREVAKRFDCPLPSAIRATVSPYDRVTHEGRELPYWDLDVVAALECALGLDRGRKLMGAYLDAGLDRMPTDAPCMTRVLFGGTDTRLVSGYEQYNSRTRMFISQELSRDESGAARSFNIDALIEYAVWAIYREGYADCPNDLWDEWGTCYVMEEQLFGHVRTKYPEHLSSHHRQLSYLMRVHETEVRARRNAAERAESARLWEGISDRLRPYRHEGSRYLITSPESAEDMIDEARMQSNCLASYVRSVERGERMIFFMREVASPAQSLVTIEVYPDGHVGQVKARNNADPTPEELAFVDEWAERVGFER